jgi:hypothetical protein
MPKKIYLVKRVTSAERKASATEEADLTLYPLMVFFDRAESVVKSETPTSQRVCHARPDVPSRENAFPVLVSEKLA